MVRPRHPKIATLVSHLFYAGRLLTPSSVTQDPGMNMEHMGGPYGDTPSEHWMVYGKSPSKMDDNWG